MRNYKTRLSLPEEEYTELLGSALYAFDCNFSFVIENIINSHKSNKDWYVLNGRASKDNDVSKELLKILDGDKDNRIYKTFRDLISSRNRIVHSFPCTTKDNKQMLRTLNDKKEQYYISKEYLLDFIKKNEEFCNLLYDFREEIRKNI